MIAEQTTIHTERPSQKHEHTLEGFFHPKSVAVIGATEKEGSVGQSVMRNLLDGKFAGRIYPVNPKREELFGLPAYADIKQVPDSVELAVIVTPAQSVPDIIEQCGEAGVGSVIVLSAGFKEIGEEGKALETKIQAIIAKSGMRVIGPNCLGVMCPSAGLNATFADGIAMTGSAALLSQSGALCTAVLDWSRKENVGFSAFVSVGSMLDVGWGDLIDYFGRDENTSSILIYMESIGDVRGFMSAARQAALSRPIIVLKAGRTERAAQAAASHTGAMASSDDALDAAFQRCGVLRVNTIAELFYMADVLVKQPLPLGPRLTVVTNAGGPGVLAADAIIRAGGELSTLTSKTLESLNEILPPQWSHNNPVDVLGDATPERYAKAAEIAAAGGDTDGVLVILTPQSMTDPTATASRLAAQAQAIGKPILASWMGGLNVEGGRAILTNAGIPTFPYPDTAARIFHYMWQYSENLQSLYATPTYVDDMNSLLLGPTRVAEIIDAATKAQRTLLTEAESKQILAAYGIATVRTIVAPDIFTALDAATEVGYPVALKLHSETITHKTDVGGVRLNIKDANSLLEAFEGIKNAVDEKAGEGHFQGVTVQPMVSLRDGYELILGSSVDAQLGPILLFGAGGQLVEVNQDHCLGLPPLSTTHALHMIRDTRIYNALTGVRGRKPVDIHALAELLVRFSRLVTEQPQIREIEINPLIASSDSLLALDARVVLEPEARDHKDRFAIRPYPAQYISECQLRGGDEITIRPIRPEDEPALAEFHEALSPESVFARYFSMPSLGARVAHSRLSRMCCIDYDREIALIAVREKPRGGANSLIGVARMIRSFGGGSAEFAVIVADPWQGRGVGTRLLQRLVDVAKQEHIKELGGEVSDDNPAMKRVASRLGFRFEPGKGSEVSRAVISF